MTLFFHIKKFVSAGLIKAKDEGWSFITCPHFLQYGMLNAIITIKILLGKIFLYDFTIISIHTYVCMCVQVLQATITGGGA